MRKISNKKTDYREKASILKKETAGGIIFLLLIVLLYGLPYLTIQIISE